MRNSAECVIIGGGIIGASIGFHLAKRLLDDGCQVVGLDNVNPYYEVALKEGILL